MTTKKIKDDNLSKVEKNNRNTKKEQKLEKIPVLEFDQSSGFMCDVDTGICGPVNPKEEE